MAHQSPAAFRVLHALRIKGFAKVDTLTDMTTVPPDEVDAHLRALAADDLALFREVRALWQLTPTGREFHASRLAAELGDGAEAEQLRGHYPVFLGLNETFKELCAEWQLRDGDPNDHTDAAYDRVVIGRLHDVNAQVQPLCAGYAEIMQRFAPYGSRLGEAARLVHDGDHQRFTGVMCNSFHDIWMELHEDLILTLGIDRLKEGSF